MLRASCAHGVTMTQAETRAPVKIQYLVMHAAFRPERKTTLERVLAQLPSENRYVYEDHEQEGSLPVFLKCLRYGLTTDATHIVCLPDDAILCANFDSTIRRIIEAKPNELICCFSNHRDASRAVSEGFSWYTTPDGSVAFGGVFPRALLNGYLEWRETKLLKPMAHHTDGGVAGDEGINLYAMEIGRVIHKPIPSPLSHYDEHELPSTEGNGHHEWRVPAVYDLTDSWQDGPTKALGMTYCGEHWRLITKLKPECWPLETVFELERGGTPVSETPMVMLATPTSGGVIFDECRRAQLLEQTDLLEHGVGVCLSPVISDSLITRGRNTIVNAFLASPATHLLWWDADLVPKKVGYVGKMLETGYDVIGGAYPIKDSEGPRRTVHSLFPGSDRMAFDKHDCLSVLDLGTGFMMIRRRAILQIIRAFPELLYLSDGRRDRGTPYWNMFGAPVEEERLLSEDYFFCRLWQRIGGTVQLFAPAEFVHLGVYPYRGSFLEQYNIGSGAEVVG
jgi:hypothetical protein